MEPLTPETIAKRVQSILAKIRLAEEKAGRPAGTVRLVAATKTVTVEHIAEGVRAGLSILGENRVQEALPKIAVFTQAPVQLAFYRAAATEEGTVCDRSIRPHSFGRYGRPRARNQSPCGGSRLSAECLAGSKYRGGTDKGRVSSR